MANKRKQVEPTDTVNSSKVLSSLDAIFQKRTGGVTNLKGIEYQMLYACYTILKNLINQSDTSFVQLEGIEDVDLNTTRLTCNKEYTQLKSSVNKMDASNFWELGVLQNFLEVYATDPTSKFKLVYNMKIANGNLKALIDNELNTDQRNYWITKLESLNYSTDTINYTSFLAAISYECISISELIANLNTLLFQDWKINKGTEIQFMRSLFYNVFIWSKDRATITNIDIRKLFQEIVDSYSKNPQNQAIKNDWITSVSYMVDNNKDFSDYYDGKAATPIHIAQELPARRKIWEKKIQDKLLTADVTLIKSSSGQGKSTLAWQVGYNLKAEYNVYQLHFCPDWASVNSIYEFIETRVLIGESPLIIIDGLNNLVDYWSHLVERTAKLPVKYIVTTRNEDWIRYGADISKINLQTVQINLSHEEAKEIFQQLKSKGKLHSEITNWQPVWEQVQELGLLIEYTYLLTRGQMIRDRLDHQIKTLNKTTSAKSKIEILRLISLADCLNLKVRTSNLVNQIHNTIGFDQDRGEVLKELTDEYFLNFDGNYIAGLHPVRSEHLKDLLHTNLPLDDSLINLYQILDDNYKHDFFVNTPFFIKPENQLPFYNRISQILKDGNLLEIVSALDGTLHSEPKKYWQDNKKHFDDAFETGGIELFIMASVPFIESDILGTLSESLGKQGDGIAHLSNIVGDLPKYTFAGTNLQLFASSLQKALEERGKPFDSFKGLAFLAKWFVRLNLELNPATVIDPDFKLDSLFTMPIEESKELVAYYQVKNMSDYISFSKQNRDTIISYLKVHTNSLTIKEHEANIHINYLLHDEEVGEVNNHSVSRIQIIHTFLPFYDQYCTEAILLPFPSEEIIAVTKQNSIKHLTPKVIGNMFDIHINQIWTSVIKAEYRQNSAFEWQSHIIGIRETAIDWCKYIVKIITSLLEGNNKLNSIYSAFDRKREELNSKIISRKNYPIYKKGPLSKEKFDKEEDIIIEWLRSLTNINFQLTNIFNPETDNARNIAVINLKGVYFELENMQEAYSSIESRTVSYFDSITVIKNEKLWFKRVYTAIQYYISHIPLQNQKRVPDGQIVISEWWKRTHNSTISQLDSILKEIESRTHYKFVLPNKIEETPTLTYITIGVVDFDFTNGEQLHNLCLELLDLTDLSFDFLSIIGIKNGIAVGGLRFRYDYFQELGNCSLEKPFDPSAYPPLPVRPNENNISTLSNINLPLITENDKIKSKGIEALVDLWLLTAHREHLDKNLEIEQKWLLNSEKKYIESINTKLNSLNISSGHVDGLKDFIKQGINQEQYYSKEDIVNQIYSYAIGTLNLYNQ